MSHLYQRTLSLPDSEDLTAEVFVVVWRRREEVWIHPDAGLLPWLLGTANNLLRQRRRSLLRARRLLDRVSPLLDEPDPADHVVERAEQLQRAAAVGAALRRLRIRDQEVIQWCIVQGLSPTTLAQMTGEPAASVRSRLSRALVRARKIFVSLEDDFFKEEG